MKKMIFVFLLMSAILTSCMLATNNNEIIGDEVAEITEEPITEVTEETITVSEVTDGVTTSPETEDTETDTATVIDEDTEIETKPFVDINQLTRYKVLLVGTGSGSGKIKFDVDENDIYKYVVLDNLEKTKTFEYNGQTLDLIYEETYMYEDKIIHHRYYYEDRNYRMAFGNGGIEKCWVDFDEKGNMIHITGSVIGKLVTDDYQNQEAVKNAMIEKYRDVFEFDKFSEPSVSVIRDAADRSLFSSITFKWKDTDKVIPVGAVSNANKIEITVNCKTGYIFSISYVYNENVEYPYITFPYNENEAKALAAVKFKSVIEELGYEFLSSGSSTSPAKVTFIMYHGKPMLRVRSDVWYLRGEGDDKHVDYVTLTAYVTTED